MRDHPSVCSIPFSYRTQGTVQERMLGSKMYHSNEKSVDNTSDGINRSEAGLPNPGPRDYHRVSFPVYLYCFLLISWLRCFFILIDWTYLIQVFSSKKCRVEKSRGGRSGGPGSGSPDLDTDASNTSEYFRLKETLTCFAITGYITGLCKKKREWTQKCMFLHKHDLMFTVV